MKSERKGLAVMALVSSVDWDEKMKVEWAMDLWQDVERTFASPVFVCALIYTM